VGTVQTNPRRLVKVVLLSLATLAGASCFFHVSGREKLPVRVQVEKPDHLEVLIVDRAKRPLEPAELPQLTRMVGTRWDYTVRFMDTGGVTVQFREIQATIRSLSGVTTSRVIPLGSRLDPGGIVPVAVQAVLSTSDPADPGNLTGVEELVFLGQDDRGRPVRVTVLVPLE